MEITFITVEVLQWAAIVVLGLLVIIEYFFISNLMEQIDLLNDRFIRLLNDNPQGQTMEHIRQWRGDIRLKRKL